MFPTGSCVNSRDLGVVVSQVYTCTQERPMTLSSSPLLSLFISSLLTHLLLVIIIRLQSHVAYSLFRTSRFNCFAPSFAFWFFFLFFFLFISERKWSASPALLCSSLITLFASFPFSSLLFFKLRDSLSFGRHDSTSKKDWEMHWNCQVRSLQYSTGRNCRSHKGINLLVFKLKSVDNFF